MTGTLHGKVVLVTGAGGGIGAATVRAIAAAGGIPVLNHLQEHAAVASLGAELGDVEHLVHEADVTDWDAVTTMVETVLDCFGRIDVLVNNAGIMEEAVFTSTTLVAWNRTLQVDLTGVFICSRIIAPQMLTAGGGVIVNLSSQLAFKGAAGYASYCTAKAGVVGLTRAMARELGPTVRVNAIAPGPVASPMTEPYQTEEWLAERTGPLVIGKLARPEQVAHSIVYLASEDASLLHGQTLHANGGGVLA